MSKNFQSEKKVNPPSEVQPIVPSLPPTIPTASSHPPQVPDLKASAKQLWSATKQFGIASYYALQHSYKYDEKTGQVTVKHVNTTLKSNEFLKGACLGYVIGVIGTRRIFYKPMICALIFGFIWQKLKI